MNIYNNIMSSGDQVNKTLDYSIVVKEFVEFFYSNWNFSRDNLMSTNIFNNDTLLNFNGEFYGGKFIEEFIKLEFDKIEITSKSYSSDGARRINIFVKGIISQEGESKDFVHTFLLCELKGKWFVKFMHFIYVTDDSYYSSNELVEEFITTYFDKLFNLEEFFSLPIWKEYTVLTNEETSMRNNDIVSFMRELNITKFDMIKCQFIQDKTANISIVVQGNISCSKGDGMIVQVFNLCYALPKGVKKKFRESVGEWVLKSSNIFFI